MMPKRPYSEITHEPGDGEQDITDATLKREAKTKWKAVKELINSATPEQLRLLCSLSDTILQTFDEEKTNAASQAKRQVQGPIPPLGPVIIPRLTAWTPADISKTFPPLPDILDPELKKAAFTHAGSVERRGKAHYEDLEWVGDAFIYTVAAEFVLQTFRHSTPGRRSQLREALLQNSNLAKYTLQYGLDKRATFPLEFFGDGREGQGGTKATEKARLKVLGDLFEAYVAALIHSDPYVVPQVVKWLRSLWAMTLESEIRQEYQTVPTLAPSKDTDRPGREQDTQLPAKVQLSQLIGCRGVKIHYKDEPSKEQQSRHNNLPLFTVGVYVDGWGKSNEWLGAGSGVSKKDAGEEAARKALRNKKAMKFYVDKKAAYQASQG